MTESERNQYRSVLERLRAELLRAAGRRDGIEAAAEADYFDEAQRLSERELAIHSLNRHSALLRDIRAALARLDEGTYGVCLDCEEAIAPRRLAAVPWASLCLKCQEAADARDREAAENPDFPVAPAA